MIGETIAHYRILEMLGQGGMGIVYRAHDEQLDRDVAIKVLPPGRIHDEVTRKRFRKEALALAKLNHPNIETVHQFASENGVDYLVTEFIPGKTLAEHLREGALPEKDVTCFGSQIAAALEEAHDRQLIHCDLKPGNVMVTRKRQAKVLDFGLARLLRAPGEATTELASEAGSLAGTLPYMAPEQLSSQTTDTRTDIYALGLVLYEMATGHRGVSDTSVSSIIAAILHQMPAPPRQRNAALTEELERIILKALDKDPDRRYQSARELRIDLERLSAPSTAQVASYPHDSLWRGIWRASRTHPWRATFSLSMFAAVFFVVFWLAGARPVLSFSARDWILISDFNNQTGESVFDGSLVAALTVSLEQSAHANVFPRAQLPDALKRMNKPPTEAINETVGREICLRENIRGLVSCRIARVGQEYLVSAQVIDPHNGVSVRSYLERAKGQDAVLNALDEIARRLRRDLGESLSSIRTNDRPLPQVTTSSLQALKNYVEGSEAWNKGKYHEATQFFANALRVDPDFAMAHAALGNADYSFIYNNPIDGKTEYEKALQLSGRVTERERLSIEVGYAANLKHVAEAVRLYNVYLDKYPDDFRVRFNYASLLRENGEFHEAIDQYTQGLRLSPKNAGAYINVATAYNGLGETAQALRYYNQAFELEPGWKTAGNLNHEFGFTLVRSGDESEARKVFDLALQKPDMKGLALRSQGWLALYHGQYRVAKSRFEDALLFYKANKSTLSETRQNILLSIVADGQGDRNHSIACLDEAAARMPQLAPKVWVGSLTGSAYARAGALRKAEVTSQLLKPLVDVNNLEQSSQFHRLEGEIALAQGKKADALKLFNLAQNEKSNAQTLEALARAYAAAGDSDQAVAWYEKLLALPEQPLGYEPQQDWLAAYYRLGIAYLSRGDKTKAAVVLGKFLSLWKEADPDLPLLRDAKAAYARAQ